MSAARINDMPIQRVAILRALQLGDLLCTVPAFRALRAALPAARIDLIGLPWAREFVDRFPHYLDGFHEFPGYPGLPEREPRREEFPGFVSRMQGERFDLVLQMHGNGTITNPLSVLLGGRQTAGFFVPGQFCPDTRSFLPYLVNAPEIWRHLRLLEFLGMPAHGEELEFPLRPADIRALEALDESVLLERGSYVCIHPGARAVGRRWPPEQFAAVADALAAEGLRIVLTGLATEAHLTRSVAVAMRAPALDLSGRTSLGSMAALLDGTRLLVCNDTGVSHLAAALGTPSVVVFHRMSAREGWAPRDRHRHRVVARPCDVTAADVLAQARDLLGMIPTPRPRPLSRAKPLLAVAG